MLETKRLIIREMCPEDLDDIYAVYEGNDLTYTEGLYDDKEQERKYIKDYQKYIYNFYDFGIWLFEDKVTGEIIGRGGAEYKRYADDTEGIELGYIVKKDKQRCGYAYEGLRAILDYIKDYFDVKEVNIRVHRDNVSSVSLAKKLGATFGNEDETGYMFGHIKI